MPQQHPALTLLIGMCLILSIGMPVLASLLIAPKKDRQSSLWFTGLLLSALGILVIALVHRSNGITATLMSIAMVFLTAALRLEVQPERPAWGFSVAWLSVYGLTQVVIDLTDQRMPVGVLITSLVLVVQEADGLLWSLRAMRLHKSRGLLVTGLALLMLILSNSARLVSVLLGQYNPERIFSFTLIANLTVLSVTLATVLLAFGYVLFMFEKAHRQHLADTEQSARAEERRQAAQAHAQALQTIIDQRDAMIMANSRFSTLSQEHQLSAYLVHETGQALQTLHVLLDTVALLPPEDHAGRQTQVARINALVKDMGSTLRTLRDLVHQQQPPLETVPVGAALAEIEPILKSQARYKGVHFECSVQAGLDQAPVRAHKVLLHRIVFNLVANAIEALTPASDPPGPEPREPLSVAMSARLERHQAVTQVVIRIEDNGHGFARDWLAQADTPLPTHKPEGMGLGLLLSRTIAQTWGGELRHANRPLAQGGGAQVEVWLPVAPAAAAG